MHKVAKMIKSQFGTGPSTTTIYHYVANLDHVGLLPLNRGSHGEILTIAYKALCMAFASFIQIQQLDLKDCTPNKQIQWLMKTMNYKKVQEVSLWERVLCDSAINISTGIINHVEERCVE